MLIESSLKLNTVGLGINIGFWKSGRMGLEFFGFDFLLLIFHVRISFKVGELE